jgi:hypothetical protein
MFFSARAAALGAAIVFFAVPAWANEIEDGAYRIAGNDAQKGAFTGEVRLHKKDATHVDVSGVDNFTRGGKQPFAATADLADDTLRFSVTFKKHGFLEAIDRFFGGHPDTRVVVVMKLTAPGKLEGTWTATDDSKFRRTDTWTKFHARVDSVLPKTIELGTNRLLDIYGADLPSPADVDKKDVAFLLDGKDDSRLETTELVERTDDGTRLRVRVKVEGNAHLGARGVRVLDATKDAVVTVIVPDHDLPLGGSTKLAHGERAKVVVPLAGGVLTVTGPGRLELLDPRDDPVHAEPRQGVTITEAGTYFVRLLDGDGEVKDEYAIKGETKPENKPYNFWYYPYYEMLTPPGAEPKNLYADGGAFEKLDKVFDLKPTGEKFDPSRHVDANAKGDAKFKMPTDPNEVAKYDPSTTKGFAYCYQRSTDSSKDWWGHCWGAVIASSLHHAPHETTVATVGTESVTFSEEQMEGLLSSYYSNHAIDGNFYVHGCPPDRPTEKTGEACDSHAHELWTGLVEGIKGQGVPLASNLRAASTSDKQKNEVWNHVIWKFEASLSRAPKQNDPAYVEIAIKVYATNDVFPSTEDRAPRTEDYVIRLRTKDGNVVAGAKDENWVSATHFCPSYLARITGSKTGDFGCDNAVLGLKIGIDKLSQKLGYTRMAP